MNALSLVSSNPKPAPAADPVFAALDRHRETQAAYSAVLNELCDIETAWQKMNGGKIIPTVTLQRPAVDIKNGKPVRLGHAAYSFDATSNATIDRHLPPKQFRRENLEARKALRRVKDKARRHYGDIKQREESASWKAVRADQKLLRTAPTTFAGATAMLQYMIDWETKQCSQLFDHDNSSPVLKNILAVLTGQQGSRAAA